MTDVHRRFLQLLMTHGVLEECDVKRLQKHCYKVHDCEYPALLPGCSAACNQGLVTLDPYRAPSLPILLTWVFRSLTVSHQPIFLIFNS